MQIRNRLALYFTIVSSCLMLLVMAFIYLLFSSEAKKDFYRELNERAEVAAQVYLEADEISDASFQKIKKRFINSLPHEVIRFYDSTNHPSFIKDRDQNWNILTIDEVRKKKYIAYEQGDKQIVGINYNDNQGDFVILVSAVDEFTKERKKNLLEIMIALFLGQILVQFLVGRWFAEKTLRPIQKVNSQVQRISATDLHLRVEGGTEKDELGTLAANFNDLLQRLEHAFDLQKMFVANASHELKTPLTSIMGEIEVAVIKDRPADEYKQTLLSVLAETEQMHNMINNFLLLANAENATVRQQTEAIRLDELLWEIKESFDRESSYIVQVQIPSFPEDENRLKIIANKSLLLLAFSNIIRNGFKFSEGQPVVCSLFFYENSLVVTITDKGIGIDNDAIGKIFEPFYRADQAHHYQGHGIGLYMSKKIVELYGGTIEVQSKPGSGSVFNIIFANIAHF